MKTRQRWYTIDLVDLEELYQLAQDTTATVMLSGRDDRLLVMFTFGDDMTRGDCTAGFMDIEYKMSLLDWDWRVYKDLSHA